MCDQKSAEGIVAGDWAGEAETDSEGPNRGYRE
jgi:hypothetical protein